MTATPPPRTSIADPTALAAVLDCPTQGWLLPFLQLADRGGSTSSYALEPGCSMGDGVTVWRLRWSHGSAAATDRGLIVLDARSRPATLSFVVDGGRRRRSGSSGRVERLLGLLAEAVAARAAVQAVG